MHGQKAAELGTAVPLSARLETRTKESMELADLQMHKPQGVVKARSQMVHGHRGWNMWNVCATAAPMGYCEITAWDTRPEVQWTGFGVIARSMGPERW